MSYRGDVGGDFSEDAPRPPVPGEEGREGGCFSSKTTADWSEAPVALRRSDLDLGFEPEGSASPDGPYEPWAETLLTLLDDRDGTALFLRFLRTLGCSALLEFWFACRGFLKVPGDAVGRRLKLAKAMYRCYLCAGAVSCSITAETRCATRDAIQRLQLDTGLFAEAHVQVQAVLQDRLFPLFLKSDVYLKCNRSPGNHKPVASGHQDTPPQREEPEKETPASQEHPGVQERRHACRRHHRALERDTRHTHLPHTPVKMTTHTFASELTRRLQELQMQTQTPPALRRSETQTDSSGSTAASRCCSGGTADSEDDVERDDGARDISETSSVHTQRGVTVVYCYDGDVIPYRTCVQCGGGVVTLGLFKSLLARRGPFRCFFKRPSAEFHCGAVYEEISEEEAVLPTFEQKIIARVERRPRSAAPPL